MMLQVGVKIFLRNKFGKYLLVQRNAKKYKTVKKKWDIVGGRIKTGEKLLSNLKREIKEETQLNIAPDAKLLCAQDIIITNSRHVVRLTFIGSANGEPILDTSENIAYEWLSVSEMKNKDDLDPFVREIIESGLVV